MRLGCRALALALLTCSCDGEQYVNAGTVQLVITDTATDRQRVNRCNYVPVLEGSRVVFRYEVAADLKAVLFVTRDEVRVTFEPATGTEPFRIDTADLAKKLAPSAGQAPEGYSVLLLPDCKPTSEYR